MVTVISRGGGTAAAVTSWTERLSQALARAEAGAGSEATVFRRACRCGGWFEHEHVSAAAAGLLAKAWAESHNKPDCAPLSDVAAFELRYERAPWA